MNLEKKLEQRYITHRNHLDTPINHSNNVITHKVSKNVKFMLKELKIILDKKTEFINNINHRHRTITAIQCGYFNIMKKLQTL